MHLKLFIISFVITAAQSCLHRLPGKGDDADTIFTGEVGEFIALKEHVNGLQVLSHYANYGCYCGYGGKGIPRDMSDECCCCHDYCYEVLETEEEEEGFQFITKTYHYKFNPKTKVVTCQLISDENASADENERLWKKCRCDLQLGWCLSRALNEAGGFSESFINYGTCEGDVSKEQPPNCTLPWTNS